MSAGAPLSARAVAAGGLRLSDIRLDGGDILWIEGRPAEGGRCAVVRRREDGTVEEALPLPYSARSGVHEYGGGALAVAGGTLFFVNQADQQVHRLDPGGRAPRALTAPGRLRHADLAVAGSRLIAVVEDHGVSPVANALASIPVTGGGSTVIRSGRDFYSSPRPSPDGRSLAWLEWDQPAMPWESTELWVARLGAGGELEEARRIAGGDGEAIFQPEWSPDGVLHLISDRTGWWNLHRWDGEDGVVPLAPMDAECGRPMWVFGLSTYAFAGPDRIAFCACDRGVWRLHVLDRTSGAVTPVDLPHTELGHHVAAAGSRVVLDAGGPMAPIAVISVDLDTGAHQVIRRSTDIEMPAGSISAFEAVEFPSRDGGVGHAFLYRPRPDAGGPPPLLVHAHGGPTSAASTALDPVIQYWTTRGFAYLDVNYAGSTGYGRRYRERLNGAWGIADVADCVDAAVHVAGRGDADAARLMITGGSAGGYVVLCALAFHDVIAAGASHYGVADPEALVRDTHKFEARYLDGLIGPYPERRDLYLERSPLNHVDGITAPVVLFQGLEDAIVPPAQAETMFAGLRARGVPCALLEFEGEQHGFRRQETIERVLEAELHFYSRVLGLATAGQAAPISIENLP